LEQEHGTHVCSNRRPGGSEEPEVGIDVAS
jgi:hypothetical protein